jgi:hypothetical protein
MTGPSPPVPADWAQLLAQAKTPTIEKLRYLEEVAAELSDREGHRLTNAFAGNDGVLARGIVLAGKAACTGVIAGFHPELTRALAALIATDMHDTLVAHQLVNFALIAESAGTARPQGFDDRMIRSLVPARKKFSDRELRSIAFSALALSDSATALVVLGTKAGSYDEPRLEFEFNIYELIRYLAAALDKRWPADWIEPAWLEYLGLFPMHLAADAAAWPDLFMFARVLAELRGDKVSDIADDLHARVQLLAKEGT